MAIQRSGISTLGVGQDDFEDYASGTDLPPLDISQFNTPVSDPNQFNSVAINQDMDDVRRRMETFKQFKPSIVPDYTKSYERYLGILEPLTEGSPSPTIYDLASSLSKGLTAQAQSGRSPSVGYGLAAGFNDFSDYSRARRQADFDQMQSMKLEAGKLAIQDVQAGEKLYQELISSQVLRDPDKLGKGVRYVKYDTDGKTVIATTVIGDKDIEAQKRAVGLGYEPIADPAAPTTILNTQQKVTSKLEEKNMLSLGGVIEEANAKADIANANEQSLAKFTFLQDQISDEMFGRGAALVGNVAEYLNNVPIIGDYISDRDISARQALKNTQMGFVLEIVAPYKGAISNKELDTFQQSVASIANEKEANQFILITSRRANQIARNYSNAAGRKYAEIFNKWKNEEISSADAQAEMREWVNAWGQPDNPESMIFTPEVRAELAQYGFGDDRLVSDKARAKMNYKNQLINEYKLYKSQGEDDFVNLTEQEIITKAGQDTDILFGGIDDFSAYHKGQVKKLNSDDGSDDDIETVQLN